jgi:hypothetical protein
MLRAAQRFADHVIHGVAHKRSQDAHVKNVESQRQQPAILEQQRLHCDDAGHDQDGSPGAEQDRGQCAADQVAGCAARDREVDHLGGENKRGQNAHQGNLPFA